MRDLLEWLVALPNPLALAALLGLLAWRRARLRRALFAFAAIGLLASALPLSGKLLLAAQDRLTPRWDGAPADVAAILVPTGGIYQAAPGEWWPSQPSVARLSRALALREGFRRGETLPLLLVTGGSTAPGWPPEAEVLLARLPVDAEGLLVDPRPRDTAETAAGATALLPPGAVVAVTDRTHLLRMVGALRAAGLAAYGPPRGAEDDLEFSVRDLLPSARGFALTARAWESWRGLLWYWARGRASL